MNYKKTYNKISIDNRNRIKEISTAKKYIHLSNFIFILGSIVFSFIFIGGGYPFFNLNINTIDVIKPFSGSVLGVVYKSNYSNFSFTELERTPIVSLIRPDSTPETFALTIPKLNIIDSVVRVDDKTLDPINFLGHYVGTPLPGESGNSFIYGHSSLPFFYNPKDYKTIFTKIPELKNGDKIYINIGDKKLIYSVKLGRELLPSQIDPYINYYPTGFNKSTITLMTCTPPGTRNFRYIVVAELEKSVKKVN
mgnify:CR=1 FL=1